MGEKWYVYVDQLKSYSEAFQMQEGMNEAVM